MTPATLNPAWVARNPSFSLPVLDNTDAEHASIRDRSTGTLPSPQAGSSADVDQLSVSSDIESVPSSAESSIIIHSSAAMSGSCGEGIEAAPPTTPSIVLGVKIRGQPPYLDVSTLTQHPEGVEPDFRKHQMRSRAQGNAHSLKVLAFGDLGKLADDFMLLPLSWRGFPGFSDFNVSSVDTKFPLTQIAFKNVEEQLDNKFKETDRSATRDDFRLDLEQRYHIPGLWDVSEPPAAMPEFGAICPYSLAFEECPLDSDCKLLHICWKNRLCNLRQR